MRKFEWNKRTTIQKCGTSVDWRLGVCQFHINSWNWNFSNRCFSFELESKTSALHLNWCRLSIHFIWTRIENQFNSFKLELKTQFFDSVNKNCWTWTVTHLLTILYTLIGLIGRAHQRVRASKSVRAAVSSICTSTYVLFILRTMLHCLEPVHQFEEFILRYSTTKCQRKWSHFDGILSWPFQKERKRNHSDRLWNGWESFWFRWGMIMDLEESIS